jgi:hypothetical protein
MFSLVPQQEAFNQIKTIIASDQVLTVMDNTLPFSMETDVSDQAIGAVLIQTYEGKY